MRQDKSASAGPAAAPTQAGRIDGFIPQPAMELMRHLNTGRAWRGLLLALCVLLAAVSYTHLTLPTIYSV